MAERKESVLDKDYSVDELQWLGVREGTSEPTGKFSYSRNGKMKEETKYVEYVKTIGAGRIRVSDWFILMEKAIEREGRTEELKKKIEETRSFPWLHSEKERKEYALESFSLDFIRAKTKGEKEHER